MVNGFIFVEGHGEVEAVHNLVWRISAELGLSGIVWKKPRRWKNLNHWDGVNSGGLLKALEFARIRKGTDSGKDIGAVLIIRDEDDRCPKMIAPEVSKRIRELSLPFPVAFVLMHPEYEVIFLPCLEQCLHLPGWDAESWEARRGIKEWISQHLPQGKSYKPTVDQLKYTRKIQLDVVRQANVPCYGTLERAIKFLHENAGMDNQVYP